MKISEFAKALEESFNIFFGCKIITEINFGGGEFTVTGFLENNGEFIVKNPRIHLYEVGIVFSNDDTSEPKVVGIDLFLSGEQLSAQDYTLEKALVYIKENLATVKSKAIYENL